MDRQFDSFSEFYPYYLEEHANPTCRRLHFVGTSLVIGLVLAAILNQAWTLLLWNFLGSSLLTTIT